MKSVPLRQLNGNFDTEPELDYQYTISNSFFKQTIYKQLSVSKQLTFLVFINTNMKIWFNSILI